MLGSGGAEFPAVRASEDSERSGPRSLRGKAGSTRRSSALVDAHLPHRPERPLLIVGSALVAQLVGPDSAE